MLTNFDMFLAWEDHPLIDLISYADDIMRYAKTCYHLQFILSINLNQKFKIQKAPNIRSTKGFKNNRTGMSFFVTI